MLLCPTTREHLLRLLPQGGEVAEIGVATGDFSQEILAAAKPRRLHLIDPWEHQDRADYARDANNVAASAQEARFEAVLARFRTQIDDGAVKVYRDYAEDAAIFFGAGQLDWIYVDGMHTAEAAYNDLVTYAPKIREGGFIVGHDYTNHSQARKWNFGVVEAVNRFVLECGYEFVALTIENFPTYVLTKSKESALLLTRELILHVPHLIEIRDFPKKNDFQHQSLVVENGVIVYPSF